MKKVVVGWALVISLQATAQNVEEIKTKYPGEVAVVLNAAQQYTIKLKDGQPYVESREKQQILYLSANAGAYMSQHGFSHSSFHELKDYEAYTETADHRKFKVTDFKTSSSQSGSVFYDDVKETRFDFPAIAPGAVGNLQVAMVHKNPHLLSPYYFTRYIPVINNELSVTFSKDIAVKYVLKGMNTDKIQFTQTSKRGDITYTFRAANLDGEKAYEDAPDNAYYSPHVVFYIEKYKNEKGEEVNFLSNIDDLYKLNRSFIKDINKKVEPELQRTVDSLIKGAATTEEKARRIYSWVQSNIKYVAFEDGMEGFIPRDANFVCQRRFGDCKDMSSILTLMLNTAGVPAYYTWIGTRSLPYTYSETPLPIVDNHMICAIQLKKDSFIFLDGTDPTCVFGLPSEHIQDKEALIAISPETYKIVKVPSPAKEVNQLVDSTFLELTDKGIKGSIALHMSGYYAMDMHGLLHYINEKDREKYMKNKFSRGSNKFQLTKYEIGDLGDKNNITLKAQFELQDYANKIGDEYYINLNLLRQYEHQEIDFPKRKMPVQFDFRFVDKYVTVLKIPDGYQVSYLPKGKTYNNATWGFAVTYEQKGNNIVVTHQFSNEHLLLGVNEFEPWNEVLKNLFPLYKETISLSKK